MRCPVALLSLALLGCTTGDPVGEAGPTQSTAAVGERIACIDATRIAGRRAENNRTLVFEVAGAGTFRNELEETCPGIARASNFGTLAVDPIESRMCRGDMVRIYDPTDIRDPRTAPRCRLGLFTRVENSPR